jgi:hypothetical protein
MCDMSLIIVRGIGKSQDDSAIHRATIGRSCECPLIRSGSKERRRRVRAVGTCTASKQNEQKCEGKITPHEDLQNNIAQI